jgi:deoxyribonuclease-4
LVDQAIDLQLPYFQFFLTHENRYVHITNDDLRYFLSFRNQFSSLFIHSSYWINPATGIQENLAISKRLILKEINYAQRLEVPFIVLHAGNAKGYLGTTAKIARQQGIDTIARFFNALLKTNPPVTFLFENTAHEGNAVGSNLEDFGLLKTKIDYPEKIGFCLDTAHAFSYGYELTQPSAFIEYINKTIGLDSLKLMHLNDSSISIGRKHDQHALPGQGKIGLHILRALATHPLLAHLSKIIEYPALIRSKSDTIAQLTDWNNYIIQIASKNAQF